MSTTGSQADRSQTVAAVASKLFGTQVTEHDVIGETLERVTTPTKDISAIKPWLAGALQRTQFTWPDFQTFSDDPLAIWVELNLGIELPAHEPPCRAKPMTLKDAPTPANYAQRSGRAVRSGQQALYSHNWQQNRKPWHK